MSAQQPDRAEAMGRRLRRTAQRLGMPHPQPDLLVDTFRAAMEPRRARIAEDHHPDYLHPARTALILMDDTGMADLDALAAAVAAETRDPSLAADPAALERISPGLAERVARIPIPGEVGADRLLETLLALEAPLGAVAAAERLDHARHLHLRDPAEWEAYHAATCASYAPLAGRIDAKLGARLAWWCETFERRYLGGDETGGTAGG